MNPIKIPIVKNIFNIPKSPKPKVYKIPISLFFSFTNIINPEIIFNDATKIIKERIINITFFSTLSAFIRVLF